MGGSNGETLRLDFVSALCHAEVIYHCLADLDPRRHYL
jgi:hypothetical protein